MNSVNLVGRLSRAPTVRFEGESQTATFTLAIQEPTREGKPYTVYVPCTSWGRAAETCSLLNAEALVSVQGKLSWRKHAAHCGQVHSQLCVQVKDLAVLETSVEVPA
jgi:single-stranded DNA-binding protein